LRRLLPSLRAKKRYLAFELISESQESISRSDIVREIMSSASALLGDIRTSECELKVLGFEGNKGILQCAHIRVKETRAALAAITRISGKRAILHVLGTSGTVKRGTEKFLKNRGTFELETKKEL
jgi:ribonuclease P/MRP protein subunit POP5